MSSTCRLTLLLEAETLYYICVGISKQLMTKLWRGATCGSAVFSPPAKWYKMRRLRVFINTFDHEAIRRRIYQLYEAAGTHDCHEAAGSKLRVMFV